MSDKAKQRTVERAVRENLSRIDKAAVHESEFQSVPLAVDTLHAPPEKTERTVEYYAR